jgi:hypothetical protein
LKVGKPVVISLVCVLLASCTYDANRLLPLVDNPATADASHPATTIDTPGPDGAPDVRQGGTRDAGVADSRVADGREAVPLTPDEPDADGTSDPGSIGSTGSAIEAATFLSGRAQGALTGRGSVSLGVIDTVTSPTCNGMQIGGLSPSMPPVTFNSTCRPSAVTWDSTTGLCVSGTIPGSSSNPSYMDYMIDWGIMVGVATREPVQAIGVAYSSIALTVSGWDSGALFAVIHLDNDASNLTYCARMTSGTAIKLSSFNTECLFGSGKRLAEGDAERIDRIGVQIPPSQSRTTVTDFCLDKIELAK